MRLGDVLVDVDGAPEVARRSPAVRRAVAAGREPCGGGAGSCRCASCEIVGEHRVGPDAERDAQLVAVEIGERARLRQHEIGDAALAGDDLLDPLVDRARADRAGAR